MALEFPRVTVTPADLDTATWPARLRRTACWLNPLSCPCAKPLGRAGVRHVLAMSPAVLPSPAAPLRSGSVVLIVGGAGGIDGCSRAGSRAIVAPALPWSGGARNRRSRQTSPRCRATPAACAISRPTPRMPPAMTEVVAAILGVVGRHRRGDPCGAGVARPHPDAHGRRHLPRGVGAQDRRQHRAADALAGETLQFFAFLSSVNVVSGSRGQSNYVAGSSFADAFARHLAPSGRGVSSRTDWIVGRRRRGQRRPTASGWRGRAFIRSCRRRGSPRLPRSSTARRTASPSPGRARGAASAWPDEAARANLGDAEALAAAEARLSQRWSATAGSCSPGWFTAWRARAMARRGRRKAASQARVAPRHAALFPALLDALGRDGLIDSADGLWRLRPVGAELIQQAGVALDAAVKVALAGRPAPSAADLPRRLRAAAAGSIDPLAVLFPPRVDGRGRSRLYRPSDRRSLQCRDRAGRPGACRIGSGEPHAAGDRAWRRYGQYDDRRPRWARPDRRASRIRRFD